MIKKYIYCVARKFCVVFKNMDRQSVEVIENKFLHLSTQAYKCKITGRSRDAKKNRTFYARKRGT